MKKLIVSVVAAAVVISMTLNSCSDTNAQITNAVKIATHQAIHLVPAEFQQGLSDYIMVGAQGVYSINGEPTVAELTAKVIAFVPPNVQQQFPLIITAITTTVALAYITYGKSGLTAIGMGLEQGAAKPF